MLQSVPTLSGRAAETRQRLLAAGRSAFARKGLAGVNLKRDLLEPAGISVGSFYHQFKDKTELLLAILAEHSAAQRERFSEVHRPAAGRSGEDLARDSTARRWIRRRHSAATSNRAMAGNGGPTASKSSSSSSPYMVSSRGRPVNPSAASLLRKIDGHPLRLVAASG